MSSRLPTSRLTALDLFSGMGGMSAGLSAAGFEVVGAVERDETSARTYAANHPDVHLVLDDIRRIEPRRLRLTLGLEPGELSLLGACPPCQGFSRLSTKNGHRPSRDERNDLVLEVLRFVAELRPAVLMLENVPGLATDARLKRIVTELAELGYHTEDSVKILDASRYGVPQRRRRMVALFGRDAPVPFAAGGQAVTTVRDAIAHLPAAGSSGDPPHDVRERRSARIRQLIARIPKDGGSRTDLPSSSQLDCHKRTTGFRDVYGRMAWDKPAPTITSGCFNPSKGRFLHPEENRAITLREAMLLQGFPQDYELDLSSGKEAAAALVGNALPPPFVAAHAEEARRHLAAPTHAANLPRRPVLRGLRPASKVRADGV